MVKLANRAKMTTPTTGTGTLTLGQPVDAFQSFAAAGVTTGDTVRYVIEDGSAWEIGTGIYGAAGPTLTRNPLQSSTGGAAIALTGQAHVFVAATTEDFEARNHRPPVFTGLRLSADGRVALTWRGAYDAAALYHAQDIVHHDGSAHIALVDDLTGQTPGASPGWQLFAAGVPASPGTPTGTLLYRDEDGLIAPLNASPAETGHLLTLDGEGRPVWAPPGNRPALRVAALETTFGNTNQHVRVIMENGDLRAWGNGAALQLGQGNTTVNRTYPGSVAFPPDTPPIVEVKADSLGGAFAIDANGDLWVWGTNTTYGNLGNATLANIPLPFCVTQLSHASNSLFGKSVAKVAMKATGEGVYSTHVLCTDGTVHAAGYNLYGQIGDGTTTNTNVFKQVAGRRSCRAYRAGSPDKW